MAPILNDVAEKMKRLMDNSGVSERELSPFCRRFETAAELTGEFEGYFNGLLDEDGDGNKDEASGEDVSETDSVGDDEVMEETVEAMGEGKELRALEKAVDAAMTRGDEAGDGVVLTC